VGLVGSSYNILVFKSEFYSESTVFWVIEGIYLASCTSSVRNKEMNQRILQNSLKMASAM